MELLLQSGPAKSGQKDRPRAKAPRGALRSEEAGAAVAAVSLTVGLRVLHFGHLTVH